MVPKCLSLLIIFCFVGCAPAANDPDRPTTAAEPTAQPESAAPVDDALKELAAEFISLRPAVGQFNGGSWNPEVDRWQGPKHEVMIELGDRLGSGLYTCSQLTDLLQPPDHTVQGGDPLHELIQTLPAYETETAPNETTQFLVYEWRGTHDFLFFVCEDGRITAADWWYAGE